MKKLFSLLTIALVAAVVSCTDESLDPLNFKSVKKGTLLALRGDFLQKIYVKGEAGAKFVPLIATGTEVFTFDAEYLSEDPNSLESIDVYVEKKPSLDKVLVKTISASEFKTTSDYVRPWVTVSLTLNEILTKLGYTGGYPLSQANVNSLVTTYKFGINIITDLNLKDGTKVLASDLVAAGLYQSNQFYPAQKLNYVVVNYCAYDAPSWAGTYTANEIYSNGAYGPYNITFTVDPGNPNRFNTSNFWDSGLDAYIEFTPSTTPETQIVKFPDQDNGDGLIKGTGTYDECTKTFKIQTQYDGSDWRYEFSKN